MKDTQSFLWMGTEVLVWIAEKKKVGRLNNLPFITVFQTYCEKVKIGIRYLYPLWTTCYECRPCQFTMEATADQGPSREVFVGLVGTHGDICFQSQAKCYF